MKKLLILFLLFPSFSLSQEKDEEHLFKVKSGDKYGYIDQFGTIKIPIELEAAREFSEGTAYIEKGEDFGYINLKGEWVPELKKISAGDFKDGLAPFGSGTRKEKNITRGFIDRTGKYVFKYDHTKLMVHPEHQQWSYFSDGRLLMFDRETKKFGYLDKAGVMVIPAQFQDARPFSEGLATVMVLNQYDEGYWQLIDQQGQFLKCPDGTIFNEDQRYRGAGETFSEGLLAVMNREEKLGFVDHECREVIPLQYQDVGHMNEGLAVVKVNDLFGFIDKTGKMLIKPQFLIMNSGNGAAFSEGLCPVYQRSTSPVYGPDLHGFIDKTGKLAIDYRFSDIRPFSHGLARVAEPLNETDPATDMTVYRVGYIDKTGRFVWETKSAGLFPLW